jgi:hypothetical protein
MQWNRTLRRVACAAALFACATVGIATLGEWQTHHDLVLPPGAPSLGYINPPSAVFLAGPAAPGDLAAWQANLDAWRARTPRIELGLRGDESPEATATWTRRAFTQDEVLIWDRGLYDETTGHYTVDR